MKDSLSNFIIARLYAVNHVQRRNNEAGAMSDTVMLRLYGDSFTRVCDVDTLNRLARGQMSQDEAAQLQDAYEQQTP